MLNCNSPNSEYHFEESDSYRNIFSDISDTEEPEHEQESEQIEINVSETTGKESEPRTIETEFPIIGSDKSHNWTVSAKASDWFEAIVDLELTDDQIQKISNEYQPDEKLAQLLTPPKIPGCLFKKVKTNSSDYYKLKSLNKTQQTTNLALKPLLTILDSMDPSDPNLVHLTRSIQLITNVNLQTSRMKRSLTSSAVKADLRPFLFSKPVTHSHLFGSEFNDVAEEALKSQNSSNKVLFILKKSSAGNIKPSSDSVQVATTTPSTSQGSFRGRGTGRGRARGRGRGRGTTNSPQ